jgi:hypothetical protein
MSPGRDLLSLIHRSRMRVPPTSRTFWPVVAAVVALAVYVSTLQTDVNGSLHPYASDVGEIQNALPHWGLIHRSGYPLYTALGSAFVTVLRPLGIQPAASASFLSALWGALAIALLVALAQELDVPGLPAALGALAAAFSTSTWVFASLTEVHTLTLALSVGTLFFAARWGRTGSRRSLLLLALLISQGIAHQRSVALLIPAVVLLAWPRWRTLRSGLVPAIGVSLLAPLTYLYLPLRAWMGAAWVLGSPGTWAGFWHTVLYSSAERILHSPAALAEWLDRLNVTLEILAADMLWPLLVLGLAGLVLLAFQKGRGRASLAATLVWIPSLVFTLFLCRGRVVDVQLSAKLLVTAMAGLGLALIVQWASQGGRWLGIAAPLVLALTLAGWAWDTRPFVLSIAHDPGAKAVIATAAQVAPPPDARPTTLVAAWGPDYWALAYAQAYQGQLPGLNLVDHNADFDAILERGDRLLLLSKIFYVFPASQWEKKLGRLYLASAGPGVVEISPRQPIRPDDVLADVGLDLGGGMNVRSVALEWQDRDRLLVTIYWQATQKAAADYSVAVHLVAHTPPRGAEDILAQADTAHPIEGWYPTSRWDVDEIVRDCHLLTVPEGEIPAAVRIALYRSDPQAGFVNSAWLSLPLAPP